MKTWSDALSEGALTGSAASVASAAALAWCGRAEHDSAMQPINAPGHWVWGDGALRQPDTSARYTAPGFLIHHASSMFWGTVQARYLGGDAPRRTAAVVRDAAVVTAVAALVDLRIAPTRLRPGFERQLPTGQLVAVYAAFGFGMAVCGWLIERSRRPRRARTAAPGQRPTVSAVRAGAADRLPVDGTTRGS